MNNFTVIYRILKAFEAAMDSKEFDEEMISPERLKISENRRNKILLQLYKSEYIEGVRVKTYADEVTPTIILLPSATITIKGLEYLESNSMMSKVKYALKEAAELFS